MCDEVRSLARDQEALSRLLYDDNGSLVWKIGTITSVIDNTACKSFFSNKWFTRRWAVQEVALAPTSTCRCGSFQRPFEDIPLAASWIVYNYLTCSKIGPCRGMQNASVMRIYSGGWYDIHHMAGESLRLPPHMVLASLQDFENNDSKDCVYAVLALYQRYGSASDLLPELIRPDYTLPLETILTRAAKICLDENEDLRLLNEIQHGTSDFHENSRILSWVPRYDQAYDQRLEATLLLYEFRADNGTIWILDPSNHNETLHTVTLSVRGYQIGAVTRTTGRMDQRMFSDFEYTKGKISEMDAILARTQNDPASRDAILSSTLCASRGYDDNLFHPADATAAFTDYEIMALQQGFIPSWPDELSENATDLERRRSTYKHEVYHTCTSRCFSGESDARVGVRPQYLAVGDVLAILFGCQWRVILRPIADDNAEYRFVGTAYVYGIMFGEATRRLQAEGRQVDDFVLI